MAEKRLVHVFRGLLTALVAGRQLLEKEIAQKHPSAAADEITAAALHPLPPALPPPPPRQPRLQFHVRSGWSEPKPSSLPQPTWIPVSMAFGIVMVSLGIVTRWYFDALGAVVIILAAWHWVAELLGDGDSEVD